MANVALIFIIDLFEVWGQIYVLDAASSNQVPIFNDTLVDSDDAIRRFAFNRDQTVGCYKYPYGIRAVAIRVLRLCHGGTKHDFPRHSEYMMAQREHIAFDHGATSGEQEFVAKILAASFPSSLLIGGSRENLFKQSFKSHKQCFHILVITQFIPRRVQEHCFFANEILDDLVLVSEVVSMRTIGAQWKHDGAMHGARIQRM